MTVLINVAGTRAAAPSAGERGAQVWQDADYADRGIQTVGRTAAGSRWQRGGPFSPNVPFDEPLSNLMPKMRAEMRGVARAATAADIITYVTHDQEEALAISDWRSMNGGTSSRSARPRKSTIVRSRLVADLPGRRIDQGPGSRPIR